MSGTLLGLSDGADMGVLDTRLGRRFQGFKKQQQPRALPALAFARVLLLLFL
jgi:hypothetical protein